MTRYYFDLREHERIVADEIGEDLPDLAAATAEAFASARALATDRQRTGRRIGTVHIEINDGDGSTRVVVPLRWAMTPLSQPPLRSTR
ncbi:MAG: hypothetical protein AB7O56_14450 [Bauldia sp.]